MGVPHLSTDGLQFVALFGSEDREEGSFRLDPHESQVGFERFALFELGFDDGEARLLIRDDSPELPLRHQHVRVPPNLRPVLVKRQRLQLGNLLGGQADVLLMPEQRVKHAGRALVAPHAVPGHPEPMATTAPAATPTVRPRESGCQPEEHGADRDPNEWSVPAIHTDLLCEQAAMATGSTPVSCHRITLQVAPGWGKGYREGSGRGLNRLLHSKRVPEPLPESLPVDFAIDRRRRLLNEDFCDAFRALAAVPRSTTPFISEVAR